MLTGVGVLSTYLQPLCFHLRELANIVYRLSQTRPYNLAAVSAVLSKHLEMHYHLRKKCCI